MQLLFFNYMNRDEYFKTKNNNMDRSNHNNYIEDKGKKSLVCTEFKLGKCNKGKDCNHIHRFCFNGERCTFQGCKFLHPSDPGYEVTCGYNILHCRYGDKCKNFQHPDIDNVYHYHHRKIDPHNKNNNNVALENINNDKKT